MIYSVLKATTGSRFAAKLEGIKPAIKVNKVLIRIKTTAVTGLRIARSPIVVRLFKSEFIGSKAVTVMKIPKAPASKPIIIASALNTRAISFFLAPILRRIPISFVRSRTEIYVIIPIIIDETTSEIEVKTISTILTASIIVFKVSNKVLKRSE